VSEVIRFAADWLRLREPVDARARSRRVLGQLLKSLGSRSALRACDLGSGTGAAIRFLAPALALPRQRWIAVEPDPDLVAFAPEHWRADGWSVCQNGDRWTIQRGDIQIELEIRTCSLEAIDTNEPAEHDLVTAQAVADVVSSEALIDAIHRLLRPGGLAYVTGTYAGSTVFRDLDGTLDPRQELVERSFHAGMDERAWIPGSRAGGTLAARLAAAGLQIIAQDSADWVVGDQDADLLAAMLALVSRSAAQAASSADVGAIAAWAQHQRALLDVGRLTLRAAHVDLLARKPGRVAPGRPHE
jgi:SAM-dependent methyltransferase